MNTHEPSTWTEIKRVFTAVRLAAAGDRGTVLTKETEHRPEIRTAVERLLAHDTEPSALDAEPISLLVDSAGDAYPAQAVPIAIGTYRTERLLGEGSSGVVYLARQDHPMRQVAVKVLHPAVVSPSVIERFAREADVLARVGDHPGIAKVIESGVDSTLGRPYIVMQYIDGEDIVAYARRHSLDIPECIRLLLQACDAVQFAHSREVIHRDLKPANLFVDREGRLMVLDFGLARVLNSSVPRATLTRDSAHGLGTLEYMSPEQVSPSDDCPVSTASDIYALAAVLYEMLTGHPPIPVRHLTLLDAVLALSTRAPVSVSTLNAEVGNDLDAVVAKALARSTGDRYQTVAEYATELRRVLAGEPVTARRQTRRDGIRRFVLRHRTGLGISVGAIVATIALLTYALVATIRTATAEADMAAASRILLGEVFTRVSSQQHSEPLRREVIEAVAGPVERWARREPNNPDAILALARLRSSESDLASSNPSPELIEERRKHYGLFIKSYQLMPTLSAARELHVAAVRVGDLYKGLGDFSNAEKWYRDAFLLIDEWVVREPAQVGLASDHFWCCTRLAELAIASGNRTDAAYWTSAQSASSARELAMAPESATSLFDALIAGVREGEYHALCGAVISEARLADLVVLGERMMRAAPYAHVYAAYHIRTVRALAERQLRSGRASEALVTLDRARAALVANLKSDPRDIDVLGAGAFYAMTDAQVKVALGDCVGAVEAAEQAWSHFWARVDVRPNDQGVVLDIGNCAGQLVGVLRTCGHHARAADFTRRVLDVLCDASSRPVSNPDVLFLYARLLAIPEFATDRQREDALASAASMDADSESCLVRRILMLAVNGRVEQSQTLLAEAISQGCLGEHLTRRCEATIQDVATLR